MRYLVPMTATATLIPTGSLCDDCAAEAEEVPASYVLADGTKVCDSHLDIHASN